MPYHLYKARNASEPPHWFGVHVEFDDDHWMSTCRETDDHGRELPDAEEVAPRFYGVTASQAHRRMVDALEQTFEEVVPAGEGAVS